LTPEEKATWEARAEQDKIRYDAEIAAYVPPPGHDARGVLIEDYRPRRKNKRATKDPHAPKRASGAYVFFTNDARPKVLQDCPGIKFVDLGKELGKRWRALPPEEKKKYEDMAAEDKVRFQMEMQQYTASQAVTAPPPPAAAEHTYYQEAATTPMSGYEAYAQHDAAVHHDPYAQHHATYHHA
jgi:hypothetical protein